MLNFFRRIFRAIFGGSDPEPTPPTTQQPPVVEVPKEKPPVVETPPPPPVEEPPKSEPISEPDDEPVSEPVNETPPSEWPKETTEPNAFVVELKRYSVGKHDILGKLTIDGEEKCYTLESIEGTSSNKGYLTKGVYNLKLRKAGGKHPTYTYRFGELHKGMLWIADVAEFPFALIHIGNKDSDTPGSILVGREPQQEAMTDSHREVWYSQQAYLAVYKLIADKISAGVHVQLKITE